jgi:predicted metal-dependent HD superfamily phosphohydrolase
MSSEVRAIRLELNGLWQTMAIRRGWRDYPQSQSYSKAASVGWGLMDRFEEPHRAYHNSQHMLALLTHAQNAQSLLRDADTVALAIWFHDAIYDPTRTDNENESAALARTALANLRESEVIMAAVEQMILATIKHQAPENASDDLKLFLDFDLSILGSAPDIYARYAAAIRTEYGFVPEDAYRPARRAVLEKFLSRDRLYFSDHGFHVWEVQARENLRAEIATFG